MATALNDRLSGWIRVVVAGAWIVSFLVPMCAARSQDRPETGESFAFGDSRFQIPAGWKHIEKKTAHGTLLLIVPPDFSDKAKFAVTVLPGQDLKDADFKQAFEKLSKEGLAANEHLVTSAEPQARKTPAGYDLMSRALIVEDDAGHRTVRLLIAANPNRRLEVLLIIADSQELIQKHQEALGKLLSGWSFSGAAGDNKAVAEEPAPIPGRVAASSDKPIKLGTGAPILRGLWVNSGPDTRSADGNHTGGVHVKDLALDLSNHTLYVAAIAVGDFSPHGGLFSSADGGKSWKELYGRDCVQIVPTATNRLYALESRDSQIIFSNDRGKTWVKCSKPTFLLSGAPNAAYVQCIAASPAAPETLYAGANGVHGAGFYKSLDGGRTWSYPTRQALFRLNSADSAIDCRDNECTEIQVDPADSNIVFARYDVFDLESHDGGQHFYGCLGYGTGAGPATRDPVPVRVVRPGSILTDPAQPQFGYLRTRRGFFRTGDAGHSWTRLALPGGADADTLALHPGSPQIVYAATGQGIFVSSDAGRTWKSLQSADAPKSAGGVTIPNVFNGTAFNSVATVVSEDEPILIDPTTGHLFYGSAIGVRVLVPAK